MRITVNNLNKIANEYDFDVERKKRDVIILYSNKYAPGITGVYENVTEALQDVIQLVDGRNPLCPHIEIEKQ